MLRAILFLDLNERGGTMQNQAVVKKYNNAEEEAERLGVRKSWIWAKARAGQIPCSKIGKYYFFIPRETDKWLQAYGK